MILQKTIATKQKEFIKNLKLLNQEFNLHLNMRDYKSNIFDIVSIILYDGNQYINFNDLKYFITTIVQSLCGDEDGSILNKIIDDIKSRYEIKHSFIIRPFNYQLLTIDNINNKIFYNIKKTRINSVEDIYFDEQFNIYQNDLMNEYICNIVRDNQIYETSESLTLEYYINDRAFFLLTYRDNNVYIYIKKDDVNIEEFDKKITEYFNSDRMESSDFKNRTRVYNTKFISSSYSKIQEIFG